MQRVLPSDEIKQRIGAFAVGLAADCDAPEAAVEDLMRANLTDATMLPFGAFLTHDGKWITGFSGYRDAAGFAEVLAEAEASPLLDATPADRKKLERHVKNAERAAGRGDWKSVLRAAADAAGIFGRCPERAALQGFEQQARAWAVAQFDAAIAIARAGGELPEARKLLNAVKRHFRDQPEFEEAETGFAALKELHQVREAEAGESPPADLRAKAAEPFAKTRWAAIFTKADGGD